VTRKRETLADCRKSREELRLLVEQLRERIEKLQSENTELRQVIEKLKRELEKPLILIQTELRSDPQKKEKFSPEEALIQYLQRR